MTYAPNRRHVLKAGAVTGAAGAAAVGGISMLSEPGPATAQPAQPPETRIVKNVCHQCPARCGIDVYVTDGKVHAIYGSLEHPSTNGKLCPKGHLGTYILYDPDRFAGPMRRTNPRKGRDQDPGFVPISWDEALDLVAARLNALRAKGEQHRFALVHGRGWGFSDTGLLPTFGTLYGSPNTVLGHSSNCSDGSKKAKQALDGNYAYNAYDYANANYLLNFGAGFLEAYRPYNNNMQIWGHIRTKAPKTRVTVVDIRQTTTGAAADRLLQIKPGTDGALALAIAHEILVNGWWDRGFVGDFKDKVNLFRTGAAVDPASFEERWTLGLIEWWNAELKDRTPDWAAQITTIPARLIRETAQEFGTTRPAIAFFERGATAHTNGFWNGMAIHALNALVGSMYAKGGLMNQMAVPYAPLPWKVDDHMDDAARAAAARRMPRIDKVGTDAWPLAANMIQEIAANMIAGDPYKLDTIMFYLCNPIFSVPDCRRWERALQDVFVIETSPFPSETAMFADLVLPDTTYLERLQDCPTYPAHGYPVTNLRVPAIPPIHDCKTFGDTLIEIGKRIEGGTGAYFRKVESVENVLRHIARGFADNPGDNGVRDFETWKEKGVWYRKPYLWRQVNGDFFEWDGVDYRRPMTTEQVKRLLLRTPSGRFELRSSYLESRAALIAARSGVGKDRVGFPQWVPPRYSGEGDLFLVTPKTAMHGEGRTANVPQAISIYQPVSGGRNEVFLEIHPRTAARRGIRNGDRVRIISPIGSIVVRAHLTPASRPDVVTMPYGFGHFAQGRWARGRGQNPSEIIPDVSDPITGLTSNYSTLVRVERA